MNNDSTSERARLNATVRAFNKRRIVVIGDLIADQFLYGEISRVSREAPVLILRHERTEMLPGGAANCALNLAALGGSASIIGIIGEDATGRALIEALERKGVDCSRVITQKNILTTTKVRILAGHAHSLRQQVIRVDYENDSTPLPENVRRAIIRNFREAARGAQAIIISDYNYGAAFDGIAALARELSSDENRRIPTLVDSRFRLREFVGFTSATPNEDEVEQLTGERITDANIEQIGAQLRAQLALEALLITRGKNGMLLLENGKPPLHIAPVGARDAVDVTGAGDTVIATYALALASGANYQDAARLANHAGAIVVMKRGTATATQEELLALLEGEH
jgi:rfaE bifunctional protein kinase chain/domain